MARYPILNACFLLISMTQVCSEDCGEILIGQNPNVLNIRPEAQETNFTCSVTSRCNFTGIVKYNHTTLADIFAHGFKQYKDVSITGERSIFTVTIKTPAQGTYYCGAAIKVSGVSFEVLGCGTQIISGGPSFGENNGIVFSILCACVGMISKLL